MATPKDTSLLASLVGDNCLELAILPYEQQLKLKQEQMEKYFPGFSSKVIPSPIIDCYRNKLRLDVGPDETGKICIGYALSKKQSKNKYVFSAVGMKHMHPKMNQIISNLEDYFNQNLKPWYSLVHTESIFNSVTIRTSFRTPESMIVMQFSVGLSAEIVEYFSAIDFSTINPLPNILVECQDVIHLIKGNKYITEQLDKYVFQISPQSFFQVNTYATEVLYNKIKELTIKYFKPDNQTNVLFDLCCGTGTIGMYLADIFTQVLGIDVKPSAIADANCNKKINRIENINFICAPIEDVLQKEIDRYTKVKFFAIVDPPRTGMHGSVQQTINNCTNLNYLIYVSCNVITLKKDLEILNLAFEPIDVHYIDLFPHTPHCEVIVVCQRKIDHCENREISVSEPIAEKPYKYIPKAIDLQLYDTLVAEIGLKRNEFPVANRIVRERRDTAWQTSVGIAAKYSNKIMLDTQFTPTVLMVKGMIEKILGVEFDSALIFHYKDGRDSMGFHFDDVGVSTGTDIAGITFGNTRKLAIRNNETKKKEFFDLGNGDIFYMFGDCQQKYKHAILLPDANVVTGPRLAITFRKMAVYKKLNS